MADWRHAGAVVAAEFRDLHVSVFAGTCDAAEGVQEAVFDSVAEEQYVMNFLSFSFYSLLFFVFL